MTAPASQSPADPQQGLSPAEEAVIVALAVFLASVVAVKAVMLPVRLVRRLTALGLSAHAVRSAARLALEPALTGRTRWGSPTMPTSSATGPTSTAGGPTSASGGQGTSAGVPAQGSVTTLLPQPPWATPTPQPTSPPASSQRGKSGPPVSMARRIAADEPTMRARYVLAAAKRLTAAAARREFTKALRRERAYLAAHRRAGQRRAKAAQAYDEMARRHGPFLRWKAIMDSRTTPDCAQLNGQLFHVDNPPFPPPGARHVHCRCVAIPAG